MSVWDCLDHQRLLCQLVIMNIVINLSKLTFPSPSPPSPSSLSHSSFSLAVDNADREHEEKCHNFRENGVFGENESKYMY